MMYLEGSGDPRQCLLSCGNTCTLAGGKKGKDAQTSSKCVSETHWTYLLKTKKILLDSGDRMGCEDYLTQRRQVTLKGQPPHFIDGQPLKPPAHHG